MDSNGRKIHGQAAQMREAGDHLKALQLSDEAMLAYQKDGDKLGFAEVLADRAIVLRHLAEDTGYKGYLLIASAEMQASVDAARESGDKTALAIPLFNLAKIYEALEDYQKAVEVYKEAIDNMQSNPPAAHNRPAIVADFKNHLAVCEYRNGDKSALERAEQALEELKNSNEPAVSQYNYDVWVSGAHMRLVEVLKEDDPTKAKEHLQKAKEVIDSNPELKLRKAQWEKLAHTIS